MSVIKYKNSKGEYVTLSGYAVSTTETVQTTGNSVAKVMSQNAVTEELNKKANRIHTHSINEIIDLQISTSSTNGLMSSTDKNYIDFLTGCNTLTSVSNVPITKRLCIVTISSNSSLSLASIPPSGRDIHLIIKNNTSNNITITIPNNSTYINIDGDNIAIGANSYGEINMISDGTKVYIRAL